MRIALLCATQRGKLLLDRLRELAPAAELVVASFREEPHEPPFLDEIRAAALRHGAVFREMKKADADPAFWAGLDLMLVACWRYRIPPSIYQRPRRGTFVFHDSLLPRYRGFAPTVWAIINGEAETGATLFRIAEGVDTGDIVAQERVPIGPDETIDQVMARVTEAYLRLLASNLQPLLDGTARATPQDPAQATYTCKRLPEDNRIDWARSTAQIHNLIRATTRPYPGAFTFLAGRKLTIWSARPVVPAVRYVGAVPGRVVEILPGQGSMVLTGDGQLLVRRVQLDGEPETEATQVLRRLSQTLGSHPAP